MAVDGIVNCAFEWEFQKIGSWFDSSETLVSPIFCIGENSIQLSADRCDPCPSLIISLLPALEAGNNKSARLESLLSRINLMCELTEVKSNTVTRVSCTLERDNNINRLFSKIDCCKPLRKLSVYDLFILKCRITSSMKISTESTKIPVPLPTHECELGQDLRPLLKEPNQFTDFIISVGNKKFPVHKVILAARSNYFATMFSHQNFKENRENTMTIDDTEPEAIEAMLEYMYTGQVTNIDQVAGNLIAVAHRYELNSLKLMCEKTLYKALDTKNACEMMILASKICSAEFIQFVKAFIDNNFREVVVFGTKNIDDSTRLHEALRLITKEET